MVGLLVHWSGAAEGRSPSGGDLFASVTGRWSVLPDTASCRTEWQELSFDSARTTMTLTTAAGRRDEYLIDGSEPDRIITRLAGDTTLDPDGVQAVWILITTSDTSYVWRRRDWFAGRVSEPSYRCALR